MSSAVPITTKRIDVYVIILPDEETSLAIHSYGTEARTTIIEMVPYIILLLFRHCSYLSPTAPHDW